MAEPSTNGSNGTDRDSGGRFLPGNPGGPGNPLGGRVARLRAVMLDAVSEDDIRTAIAKLVELARSGDLAAIRELLDRSIGKVATAAAEAAPAPQGVNVVNGVNIPERMEEIREILRAELEVRRQQRLNGGAA